MVTMTSCFYKDNNGQDFKSLMKKIIRVISQTYKLHMHVTLINVFSEMRKSAEWNLN